MPTAPTRKQLKAAMLAIFLEKKPKAKTLRSKEFTRLLFSYAKALKGRESEREISSFQMEAVGLFGNYLLRKQAEKSKHSAKAAERIFEEIADESDELFDEIESRA
jgi:hypothetical protein